MVGFIFQIVLDLLTCEKPTSPEATNLKRLRNNEFPTVACSRLQRYILPLDCKSNFSSILETTYVVQNAKDCSFTIAPESLFDGNGSIDQFCINRKFAGKKYRFVYGTSSFLSGRVDPTIWKIDVETKEFLELKNDDYCFAGEPYFVNNPTAEAEDSGMLVCPFSSPNGNIVADHLLMIDCQSFEKAKASFKSSIPVGLHGVFI